MTCHCRISGNPKDGNKRAYSHWHFMISVWLESQSSWLQFRLLIKMPRKCKYALVLDWWPRDSVLAELIALPICEAGLEEPFGPAAGGHSATGRLSETLFDSCQWKQKAVGECVLTVNRQERCLIALIERTHTHTHTSTSSGHQEWWAWHQDHRSGKPSVT